jgi:hypothetical protein
MSLASVTFVCAIPWSPNVGSSEPSVRYRAIANLAPSFEVPATTILPVEAIATAFNPSPRSSHR